MKAKTIFIVGSPGIIARPTEEECDEETLLKIEGAYVNENSILSITHKGILQLPFQLMGMTPLSYDKDINHMIAIQEN